MSNEAYRKICDSRKKSLIGKFMGNRPILQNIRKWFKTFQKVKGEVTIPTLPCDFIMFNFNLEEDLEWVMEIDPWWFEKSGLHLKKWYEGFNQKIEIFSSIPMWILLPKLPLDFQFEEAITGIASIMGEFICLDMNTRMGNTYQMDRFYANINIYQPMKLNIFLKNKNGGYLQDIIFYIPPMICKICNKYGHTNTNCPTKAKQINNQGNKHYKGNRRNTTTWKPI